MDTLVFVHGHGHGCNYSHRSSPFATQFSTSHRIAGRRHHQVSPFFLSTLKRNLNFKISNNQQRISSLWFWIRNRSSPSVNTSSSSIVLDEQVAETSENRNFVYKVVSLSGSASSLTSSSGTDRSTTTPEPLVFVTAPSTSSNIQIIHHYFDDYYTVRSAFIVGLRVEDADSNKGVSYDEDGTPNIQAGKPVSITTPLISLSSPDLICFMLS
jgi:hypothetical protein